MQGFVVIFALTLALAAMGDRVAQQPKPHNCIHDQAAIQNRVHAAKTRTSGKWDPKRTHKTLGVGPIRIHVSDVDFYDTSKHCTAVGEVRPDFNTGDVTCTSDDVLTPFKREIFAEQVIPGAVKLIESFLRVDQVAGMTVGPACVDSVTPHTLPSYHNNPGLSNVDFVLYVTAGPTSQNVVAWAGACTIFNDGRPASGIANFGPRWISGSPTAEDLFNMQRIAAHEIMHALGFSDFFMENSFVWGGVFPPTQSATVRGHASQVFTGANVVAKARNFFGCPSLPHLDMENEGGAGSANSHWDRHTMKDDIMAPGGGFLLSEATIAYFADMGYYQVDYAAAENDRITWGKGHGCGFVQDKCDTVSGGKDTYFCFNEATPAVCNYKKTGYGTCDIVTYENPVDSWGQYFANPNKGGGSYFLDYCPVVVDYGDRDCEEVKDPSLNDMNYGHNFGAGGTCVQTSQSNLTYGLSKIGVQLNVNDHGLRCLRRRCNNITGVLEFSVGGVWVSCPADGSAGNVEVQPHTGYYGRLACPAATDFCAPVTPVPQCRTDRCAALIAACDQESVLPCPGDHDPCALVYERCGTSAPVTPTPTTAAPPTTPVPPTYGPTVSTADMQNCAVGQSGLRVRVTGKLVGMLWGSNPYTDDSDIQVAAVHAGLTTDGVTREIIVHCQGAEASFPGTTANGVTTSSYGSWPESIALEVAPPTSGTICIGACMMHKCMNAVPGIIFYFTVTGINTGNFWGTVQYTDDSPLALAAVHMGYVAVGETKTVATKCIIAPASYTGSTANGVTSTPYSGWPQAYEVIPNAF